MAGKVGYGRLICTDVRTIEDWETIPVPFGILGKFCEKVFAWYVPSYPVTAQT